MSQSEKERFDTRVQQRFIETRSDLCKRSFPGQFLQDSMTPRPARSGIHQLGR